MIDFSQVTSIRRQYRMANGYHKEDNLKYIDYQEAGKPLKCLWKRPLSYPVMGFELRYPVMYPSGAKYFFHKTSWLLVDQYGVSCYWKWETGNSNKRVKNADGTYDLFENTEHLYVSTGREAEAEYVTIANAVQWPNPYGDIILEAHMVYNEAELMDYPKIPPHIALSSIEYSFSDVTTKKIKLYARKKKQGDEAVPSPYVLTSDTTHSNHFTSPKLRSFDTEVEVDAGQPLVTIGSLNSGKRKITGIRTNLDDYKAKYDAATGGKFPKSEYPYLRATIAFRARNIPANIQNRGDVTLWDAMYLTFEVDR